MVNVLQVLFGLLVAMLMLGLGATVRGKDITRVKTKWKAPLLGFLCQYGIMPLAAFLLAMALGVSDVVAISMIAIGATPGGSTSNLFTLYSKGDVALSITMTILSNLAAFGMLPLLLLIYTSHLTDDLQIPFTDILTSLLLVLIPACLGMVIRRYRPKWAKITEKVASILGVLFIIGALIFGSISEESIWSADWQLFFAGATLLLIGAAFGYLSAWMSGMSRHVCRTIALETGLQNSTFTIAVLTLSFGGDDQDQDRFNEILQFPLLYSFFVVVDGILLTFLFHYLAKFDPAHEQAEYADEEAKRAAEIALEDAEAEADADAPIALKDDDSDGNGDVELTGGAAQGASAPVDSVDSPHAAAEAGEASGGEETPSLAPLITHTDGVVNDTADEAGVAAETAETNSDAGAGNTDADELVAGDAAPVSADAIEPAEGNAANGSSESTPNSAKSSASPRQVAPVALPVSEQLEQEQETTAEE